MKSNQRAFPTSGSSKDTPSKRKRDSPGTSPGYTKQARDSHNVDSQGNFTRIVNIPRTPPKTDIADQQDISDIELSPESSGHTSDLSNSNRTPVLQTKITRSQVKTAMDDSAKQTLDYNMHQELNQELHHKQENNMSYITTSETYVGMLYEDAISAATFLASLAHTNESSLAQINLRKLQMSMNGLVHQLTCALNQIKTLQTTISRKAEKYDQTNEIISEPVATATKTYANVAAAGSVCGTTRGSVSAAVPKQETVPAEHKITTIVVHATGDNNPKNLVKTFCTSVESNEAELGLFVRQVKKGIVIKCSDPTKIAEIKEITRNLDNAKTITDRKLYPSLEISGIPMNMSPEDATQALKKCNPILNQLENQQLKLVTELNNRQTELKSLVFRTDGESLKKVLQQRFLRLNAFRCQAYEYFRHQRCTACLRYGQDKNQCKCCKICLNIHTGNCNSEQIVRCMKCCLTGHLAKDCAAPKPSCNLCSSSKRIIEANKTTEHRALSRGCHFRQLKEEEKKSIIDYDLSASYVLSTADTMLVNSTDMEH